MDTAQVGIYPEKYIIRRPQPLLTHKAFDFFDSDIVPHRSGTRKGKLLQILLSPQITLNVLGETLEKTHIIMYNLSDNV